MRGQRGIDLKLNTGKAWDDASRMIASNREVVLVLTGIFFFIPLFVLFLNLSAFEWNLGDEPSPERIEQQVNLLLQQNWWAILLLVIGQWCGTISLLALLADPDKPTVGDAMKSIPRLLLSVVAVQVLVGLITQLLPTLAGFLPSPTGDVVNFVLLPVTIYLSIKFTLAVAVIVIDKTRNPIEAMRASWRLTKGNSLRIFVFLFALVFVAMVLGLVAFMVIGLILAALGTRVQMIGTAALIALIFASYSAVSVAVIAAIHRQLSRADQGGDKAEPEDVTS